MKKDNANAPIINMTVIPSIYAFNMSISSLWEFRKYVKAIFTSKRLSPQEVITKISVQEKSKGKNSWNALKFDFVDTVGE